MRTDGVLFACCQTYLCHLSDKQDRRESLLHVDMLNSCWCNAERNSWKAHLCTRSVSINISHVQKLLWGGPQFLMKRRDHQSLSARNIELPLPFTLMANPSRDEAGPLDQARRASYTHHMHPPPRWDVVGWLQWKKTLIQTRTGTICIVIK